MKKVHSKAQKATKTKHAPLKEVMHFKLEIIGTAASIELWGKVNEIQASIISVMEQKEDLAGIMVGAVSKFLHSRELPVEPNKNEN